MIFEFLIFSLLFILVWMIGSVITISIVSSKETNPGFGPRFLVFIGWGFAAVIGLFFFSRITGLPIPISVYVNGSMFEDGMFGELSPFIGGVIYAVIVSAIGGIFSIIAVSRAKPE